MMTEKFLEVMEVAFFRNHHETEPVRSWLKKMNREDKLRIGTDIKTLQFGWPMGMPVCRPMGDGLHEIRSHISGARIARTLFCVDGGSLILLHGFIKKSRGTPGPDLELARRRQRQWKADK